MVDLTVINDANELSAVVTAATKKLKEYVDEHEGSEDEYFDNVRELQKSIYMAHAKWLKFSEQNLPNWG